VLDGNEVIAAITPSAILTARDSTGQTGREGNRDYVLRRALIETSQQDQISSGPAVYRHFDWTLRCLDRAVRRVWDHGHGGCLVCLPKQVDWRDHVDSKFGISGASIENPLRQSFTSAMKVHDDLDHASTTKEKRNIYRKFCRAEEQLRWNVDWVGGLSRVDGAVLIGADLSLFAFGAKIRNIQPEAQVLVFDCIGSKERFLTSISKLGGTRHQSAATLVG